MQSPNFLNTIMARPRPFYPPFLRSHTAPRLPYARSFSGSVPKLACHSSQSKHPNSNLNSSSSHQNKNSESTSSLLSSSFWSCRSTWGRAGLNTLRCLAGCTVGDFSALWMLQTYYPELGMNSIMLASSMFTAIDFCPIDMIN